MRAVSGVILFLLLTGCANPQIVRISPDTYMLSREDHAGIFGSSAKMKSDVIREANAFAESQGKIAIPLATKEKPIGMMRPADWATVEYQFRVVDKNDPEAQRISLVPRPDFVVDKTERISADIHTKDTTEKQPDLYAELTKLDDLRKKGVITETEFSTQKTILLNKQR